MYRNRWRCSCKCDKLLGVGFKELRNHLRMRIDSHCLQLSGEAIAFRLEAGAIWLEAIPLRLEAIAIIRLEGIAIWLEAIAI